MVFAVLLCSDVGCAERFEAFGPLEELEALACDCGCALAIVGWPEPYPVDGRTVEVELLAA